MAKYYLPGIGGQIENPGDPNSPYQSSPLLDTYSPRLFGSPPQLSHLNDMRLMSADPNTDQIGPVGDFYLTKILQDAQVANFVVGKALFTGGMSSIANIIRVASQYGYAMSKYDIFDSTGQPASGTTTAKQVIQEANVDTYKKALSEDDGTMKVASASSLGFGGLDKDTTVADLSSEGNAKSILDNLS